MEQDLLGDVVATFAPGEQVRVPRWPGAGGVVVASCSIARPGEEGDRLGESVIIEHRGYRTRHDAGDLSAIADKGGQDATER